MNLPCNTSQAHVSNPTRYIAHARILALLEIEHCGSSMGVAYMFALLSRHGGHVRSGSIRRRFAEQAHGYRDTNHEAIPLARVMSWQACVYYTRAHRVYYDLRTNKVFAKLATITALLEASRERRKHLPPIRPQRHPRELVGCIVHHQLGRRVHAVRPRPVLGFVEVPQDPVLLCCRPFPPLLDIRLQMPRRTDYG